MEEIKKENGIKINYVKSYLLEKEGDFFFVLGYYFYMKSPKECILEKKFLKLFEKNTVSEKIALKLVKDEQIQDLQDYANTVAIKRLGFNDHGPVHMRQVAFNAVTMLYLLKEAGIKTSLEKEEIGTFEDSLCAVELSAFLHDVGMSIGRQDHELMGTVIAGPVITRILSEVKELSNYKKSIISSMAIEGIFGHMATRKIHSLEAGLILIADGCDMEKGRSRIPMAIKSAPKYGDIHKYSSAAIDKVLISKGEKKPIRILVQMSSDVGYFQIEEVLLPKINMSPVKKYVELVVKVLDGKEKHYL